MGEAAPALIGSELVLNRYRPLRPLGSGGSGSVWLSRDEKTGLDVALKIVAREGKSAARAEREAKAAAQLRHPACLRAYAFGRDSRHVYIAYEFVPGRTYREVLRDGDMTQDAAIEACAQVCDGLAHAHAAGILHRDVKPSNVLLMDGERISARVLDFGLAQMAEAETLTEAGDVPGTLAYISPERLAGGEATPAADVWAVGVMLWEALAGRHPFWRGSMLETARAIEAGARPLGELRPDLLGLGRILLGQVRVRREQGRDERRRVDGSLRERDQVRGDQGERVARRGRAEVMYDWSRSEASGPAAKTAGLSFRVSFVPVGYLRMAQTKRRWVGVAVPVGARRVDSYLTAA